MRIEGYDKLIKDLRAIGVDGEKRIAEATELAADKIKQDAQTTVSYIAFSEGDLGRSITAHHTDSSKLTWKVLVGMYYGAFVEFGTGPKVDVPPELADVALEFKGLKRGNFAKALDSIAFWCKRKGIPQEAAYPILISILNEGLEPRPFLYPAFTDSREKYIKDLESALNELTKDK